VNLTSAEPREVICYLTYNAGTVDNYDHHNGARISAIFVILFLATVATMFPVLAVRSEKLRIPLYVYLFARYFGSGVIIATAFIHLLDPAYAEIGPQTCVGMTGAWANYSWPPAIAMTSAMCVFLLDFTVECHVQAKYGLENVNVHGDVEGTVTRNSDAEHHPQQQPQRALPSSKQDEGLQGNELPAQGNNPSDVELAVVPAVPAAVVVVEKDAKQLAAERAIERDFQKQISAFLVLEFGVIFHSIIIGLNLGVAGSEFRTLYPVLSFHQAFEGLGIGARLSTIPFPHRLRYAPWLLCLLFGMTTPIAIAIGLGLRSTYSPGSFTADVVSGILDSTSAGILLYTGFVEFLARDFMFHPERSADRKRVTFMICCLYLGIGLMALLGKWA
jgi:zinc transporter 1/2/3